MSILPILMYHQVAELPKKVDPLGLAVPPAQFEQQMSYLADHGYHCYTLAEVVKLFQKSSRPQARSFVLTFDDGYQDVHSNAYPILEKFGFTAAVFLVVGRMGSPSNWWGQEGAQSGLLLTWAEARNLASRGFIMGSHTLNHPWLNTLDDQSAFEEIRNSKDIIQDQLNNQVNFFSYPYSYSDARIERMVELAGYTAACAGDMGHCSTFHLWRVPCTRNDTTLSFALKVSGFYNKRTALRESIPGKFLRHNVRMIKRWVRRGHHGQPDGFNLGLGEE